MVCRYHSITRAADALYVSQPTISTSIRDLEKEFHLKLFNHGKNRISLTKDGEAFYQKAEYILRQTQELYSDFSNIEENRHPLRIGIPPMISTVFFPRVTDQFQEQYNIPIQLLEYGSIRARTLVDNEQLDPPIVQMDFKADEFHDPMLNDSIIKALGLATQEEIDELTEKALKINEVLSEFLLEAGIILVDFKVEFGKDKNGEIILGDEISPDGCRLWDSETLDMLDKELFRKGKDNEVMDAYVEVYNRIIPDDEKIEL